MTTHIANNDRFERAIASPSCKLLACAALSLAITLLTFTTIANSAADGLAAAQPNALAQSVALPAPAAPMTSG